MFRNIKKIIFIKKSLTSNEEYFQIEVQKDKNILRYTDFINIPKIVHINDDLVIQYFDNLFRIIDNWDTVYENNSVIDGIEWQLQIIYKNDETKYYSGKNDFPNNFEYLDKMKYEIIECVGE